MKKKKYPTRAADVPVTQAMLYGVRDELKGEIRSGELKTASLELKLESLRTDLKGDIKSLDLKVESRFEKVESRMESGFKGVESRFNEVESRIEKLSAKLHSVHVLIEEQSNKNNIVLDGLTNLFARQERFEKWLDQNA